MNAYETNEDSSRASIEDGPGVTSTGNAWLRGPSMATFPERETWNGQGWETQVCGDCP